VAAVHDGAFGMMVALQAGEIVRVPIADAVAKSKTVDLDLYRSVVDVFLG
jgi:6-phosphofructokinase 1